MSNQNQGESRFESVRKRIRAALLRVGRDESELTLIGASKLQSPETVAVALRAGLGCLGENYVQEAGQKHAAIRALARSEGFAIPRWHMIGALQRNKTKRAVSLFDVIQTVDRSTLAREIDKCAAAQGPELQGPAGPGRSWICLCLFWEFSPTRNYKICCFLTFPGPKLSTNN